MIFSTLGIYICREFIKIIAVTALGFISIFILSSTFDVLSKYKVELSSLNLLMLVVMKLPYLVSQCYPMIILVAEVIFISLFLKTNQMTLVYDLGKSLNYVMFPVAFTAFLLSMLTLLFISPLGSKCLLKLSDIEREITKRESSKSRSIFSIEKLEDCYRILGFKKIQGKDLLQEPVIFFIDKNYNLIGRIDAQKAYINSKVLTFEDYKKYGVVPNKDFKTDLKMIDLKRVNTPPENVPLFALLSLSNRYEKIGIDYKKYKIYLYKQLLKPFITTIICSLILRIYAHRQAIGLSVVISTLTFYWVCLVIMQVMLYRI